MEKPKFKNEYEERIRHIEASHWANPIESMVEGFVKTLIEPLSTSYNNLEELQAQGQALTRALLLNQNMVSELIQHGKKEQVNQLKEQEQRNRRLTNAVKNMKSTLGPMPDGESLIIIIDKPIKEE